MLFLGGVSLATTILAASTVAEALQPHITRNLRSLRAAKVTPGLESRDSRIFEPRSVIDLKYEDDLGLVDPYYATLRMGTKKPTILLEHMDDVVSRVVCSSSGIQMQFTSSQYTKRAQDSWIMPEFIVITSNEGCNKHSQRLPYMVSGVSFSRHNTAMLTAKPISWANASRSIELEFGTGPTIAARSASSQFFERDSTVSKDMSFSFKDQQLIEIEGITEKCKDCSGQATFTMTSGVVKLLDGFDNFFHNPFKSGLSLSDFADAANVEISVTNMGGRFEFETEIEEAKSFSVPLLGAPVSLIGLEIAGLIEVGPQLNPLFLASIKQAEPLSFTYGFDVTVPDGSSMTIDLVDIAKSSTSGFEGTTFNALPLTIDKPQLGVNFSLAFRPTVEFGVTVLDFDLDPVTAFVDAPKYDGTIELLTGVDENCAPTAAGGTTAISYSADVEMDVGVGVSIGPELGVLGFKPQKVLASTKLLPFSTCIPFGGSAQSTAPVGAAASAPAAGQTSAAGLSYAAPTVTSAALAATGYSAVDVKPSVSVLPTATVAVSGAASPVYSIVYSTASAGTGADDGEGDEGCDATATASDDGAAATSVEAVATTTGVVSGVAAATGAATTLATVTSSAVEAGATGADDREGEEGEDGSEDGGDEEGGEECDATATPTPTPTYRRRYERVRHV